MKKSVTKKKSLTFGIILPSLHEGVQSLVWPGIEECARRHGVKLVTYVATSQDQVNSLDQHYEVIHDFVQRSAVDGCIIFTGAMAEHVPVSEVKRFCTQLREIPVVCIALSIPRIPSILVDNRAGIIENITHLARKHNCRRIAFVKGPQGHEEAEERFDAYCEGLRKNALPVDDELIFPGQFSDDSGIEAVTTLVTRNISFDAVVTADDETAFGVISELKRRGIQIPAEVAVAGFDDVVESSLIIPSLTTVRQPLHKQGKTAFYTLWDICHGKNAKTVIHLPTESVFRRSCGCFPGVAVAITNDISTAPATSTREEVPDAITAALEEYFAASFDNAGIASKRFKELVKELVHAFIDNTEHDTSEELFLNAVDSVMNTLVTVKNVTEVMQGLISAIASYIPFLFKESEHLVRANRILQQAGVFIHEHAIHIAQSQTIQKEEQELKIRETSQKLITTFELSRLLRVMSDEFPRCGIRSCCFALYKGEKVPQTIDAWTFPESSTLMLAFQDHEIYSASKGKKRVFSSAALLPDDVFDTRTIMNTIFLPLFFEKEHFGFIIFEHNQTHQFFMYEELRLHLSSALKSSFMLEELKVQSIRDELTNLYNRRGFISLSNQMIQTARKNKTTLWVFYIDLDRLKYINDTYGHEEGDFVIAEAAQILVDTFRKQDIIGRIGGDEFTVILTTEEKYKPEKSILIRLQQNIDAFNRKIKKRYTLSMSVGVKKYTNLENETLESLMKAADDQMIIRKKAKKNKR